MAQILKSKPGYFGMAFCVVFMVQTPSLSDSLSFPQGRQYCSADMPVGVTIPAEIGYDSEGDMVFCQAAIQEAPSVFYGWGDRHYEPQEERLYPLQILDTKTGAFVIPGREARELWIQEDIFLKDILFAEIDNAFPEKGKADIALVAIEWREKPWTETEAIPLYLIDFDFSPPKVFADVPLAIGTKPRGRRNEALVSESPYLPPKSNVVIQEKRAGIYTIYGWTTAYEENDSVPLEYIYDRNKATIIKDSRGK